MKLRGAAAPASAENAGGVGTNTALAITQAVVNQVYAGGMQFRTPEALTGQNTFRACHYLRAMAIWALWATHTDWELIPGAERQP